MLTKTSNATDQLMLESLISFERIGKIDRQRQYRDLLKKHGGDKQAKEVMAAAAMLRDTDEET